MEVNDYVIQYPIDAVHTVKFAELLGKPETAVVKMVKENKLPVIELRDPSKPNARVGEKWVFIPEFTCCPSCGLSVSHALCFLPVSL